MKQPSYCRRITLLSILIIFNLAASGQDLVAVNDYKSETAKPKAKEISVEAPVHQASHFQDDNGKLYWQKKLPVYLFASSNPNGSDIKKLKSETNPDFANPIFLDTEGVNYIRTRWAVDSEGKKIMPEQEIMMEIYADGIAPISRIQFDANTYTANNTTYFGKELKTSINALDRMSGVDKIYASIDNMPYQTIEDKLNIAKEGTHSIKYFAVDHVGNTEIEREISFVVDITAPESKLELEGVSVEDILSPKTKLVLTSADELSGVKKVYYTFDDSPKAIYTGPIHLNAVNEGDHKLTYYAEDYVGNIEESKTYNFFLDKTPTVVDYAIATDKYENESSLYVSARSAIALSATDNKAGVNHIYYSLGNDGFKNYESNIATEELNGTYTIKFYGDDKVTNGANLEAFTDYGKKVRFTVDTEGPSLSYQFNGKKVVDRDTTFITSATSLSLLASDGVSGVKELTYKVNGSGSKAYSENLLFENEGVYNLVIESSDNVNNTSEKPFVFVVDNTGPEVTSVMGSSQIGNIDLDDEGTMGVYSKGVHVYLAATDKIIETQDIYFVHNDGKRTRYENPIVLNEKGINTIQVFAYDKLGNENAEETIIKVFVK